MPFTHSNSGGDEEFLRDVGVIFLVCDKHRVPLVWAVAFFPNDLAEESRSVHGASAYAYGGWKGEWWL